MIAVAERTDEHTAECAALAPLMQRPNSQTMGSLKPAERAVIIECPHWEHEIAQQVWRGSA